MLKPTLRYAFHPILPQKLGFRRLLQMANPRLSQLVRLGDGNTLMSARNRTTLYREGEAVLADGVPGDFVEIGVHRGGSAAILAGLLEGEAHRKLHLFDRWGDLPEPTEKDGHRQAEYARDAIADKLQNLAQNSPLRDTRMLIEQRMGYPRAVYWDGWYHDTFPRYDGGAIAFASIDCDYYESVALSLDFVAARASPGCRIVVDDYDTWPGAKAALDEFTERAGAEIVRTGIGPALLRLT